MTWTSHHQRGETLTAVIATADARLDGVVPLDVDGVTETFRDELTLLGALQLRWHTRLAGRIDRELMHQPMDLESAVVRAWHATADELPGVHLILERFREHPGSVEDSRTAATMAKAIGKERILLAIMSGRANVHDTVDAAAAVRVGRGIEDRARHTLPMLTPARLDVPTPRGSLLERLRAALVA